MYNETEIRSNIQKLTQAGNNLTAKAMKENRDMTAEEVSLHQECMDEIENLKGSLPMPTLTVECGPVGGASRASQRSGYELRAPSNGRDFRSMFCKGSGQPLDSGGFKDAAEFLRVLDSGRYDPRLQNSLSEGIPSAGGFSVPQTYVAEWLDASLPSEIIRNLCKIYPMTSETTEAVGFDGADMSSGNTHGGLAMEFLAEGEDGNKQTPKLRKILLTARTGAIYVDASLELVQDGRGFAENLQSALIKSIGYGIDKYLFTGSGAGCPQGVLSAACKIEVTKETGQKADTLMYSNLKKMFARQLNPGNAVWIFNSTAIPDLLETSVAVGTGGSFVPLLNENNGTFSIFGRPVYFSPHMKKIGDAGDCAFIDFSFYALGLRSDASIDISDIPRWVQRERSYRVLLRFDGQCTLDKPVTPENGDSLSPVVVLGERA